MGDAVTDVVLSWLETGTFPNNLSNITIVLIPKKSVPEIMGNLRPIALCNVLYKIALKMIANRMKDVLLSIISEN